MPGVRMRCAQKMSRAHNYEVNVRSDPRLRAHASLCYILRASQITSCLLTKIASELETFVLDSHNPVCVISISTLGNFNLFKDL